MLFDLCITVVKIVVFLRFRDPRFELVSTCLYRVKSEDLVAPQVIVVYICILYGADCCKVNFFVLVRLVIIVLHFQIGLIQAKDWIVWLQLC